jgi:hypothetical protein
MSDQLLERLARLEARVAELGVELQAARDGRYRAMRDSRRCPACGIGDLVHVKRMQQASHVAVVDFAIRHVWNWTGPTMHGPMEAFVCRGCGLVEIHVTDFKDVVDNKNVVAIAPEPPPPSDGPFR